MRQSKDKVRSMARNFQRDYLIIAVFPFLILLITGWIGIRYTEKYLDIVIADSLVTLKQDTNLCARNLAESSLSSKSQSVAQKVDEFLKTHPQMTLTQLQKDPFFLKVALQQVGKSGYTLAYEAPDSTILIHPDPNLIGEKLASISESLPHLWQIIEPTLAATEGSGYYRWQEDDGNHSQKFISVTPVETRVEGKVLLVAATAYLDEFIASIKTMDINLDEIAGRHRQFVFHQTLLINSVAFLAVIVILCCVYILHHRAVLRYIRPIEKLSEAVKKVGEGDWEFSCPVKLLERQDEIGDLTRAFDGMSLQMQQLINNLEQRLEEVKLAQMARQESESHYRNLFNSVPIGLYRTDPEGKVIDVNNALERMLKYDVTHDWEKVNADQFYLDPAQRLAWKKRVEGSTGIYTCEKQFRRFDGSIIWVEDQAHAVRDERGRVQCFEGSLKDITESKEAELALKENERNYKALYEESTRAQQVYESLIHSSADAIVISELTGNTQYVSPVFTQWFGWSKEELEGRPIPFIPESEIAETGTITGELVAAGKPCQAFATKRFTKDGRVIDVSISASRFNDHEGKPAGILTIMRDISEKKKLEAQLQHVERMEAIGTLAGGIAHDFNNLMMGMQGNISLMLCNMKPTHPYYGKLKSIENMIESGAKLTRHLLGYARKGKYESQPMNLNLLIRESSETFRRTRKAITLHLQLADQINTIEADRSQIEQVVMNLYINAGDAMPDGGDLFLKTEMLTDADFGDKPYAPKPGNYALLTVTDTGEGIDPQYINRIFDPFFTTKEMGRGTGLGLASVYGIVKAHGGYIDVTSKLGQGTTFQVYLPTTETVATELPKPDEQMVPGRGKILIVDDEAIVIEVCEDMLRKAGFTVESATSGQEAVRKYKAHSDQIDLVILDMVMPRMSGGDVFDQIKTIRSDAKVILASGYSIEGQAAKILNRGCNGFIQKPFSLQQLTGKIDEVLSGK